MEIDIIKDIENLNNEIANYKMNLEPEGYSSVFDMTYNKFIVEIKELRNKLIILFGNSTLDTRQKIWDTLPKYRDILHYITYPYYFDNKIDFSKLIVLEIVRNLHPDPRDVFMEFSSIIKMAKSHNIDWESIFIQLSNLADSDNWSSFGSMKEYLLEG